MTENITGNPSGEDEAQPRREMSAEETEAIERLMQRQWFVTDSPEQGWSAAKEVKDGEIERVAWVNGANSLFMLESEIKRIEAKIEKDGIAWIAASPDIETQEFTPGSVMEDAADESPFAKCEFCGESDPAKCEHYGDHGASDEEEKSATDAEAELPKDDLFRECKIELTDEDKHLRTTEMLRVLDDIDEAEEEFAEVKGEHKAKVKALALRHKALRTAIQSGFEWRNIPCFETYNFEKGMVRIVRKDNNETVETRPMTEQERFLYASGQLASDNA